MKKIICCIFALLLALAALAEAPDASMRVTFEDGFSLELPDDWVSFEVDSAAANAGVLYCLGAPDASKLMYVQRWASDFAALSDLENAVEARDDLQLRSSVASDFVMYNFIDADCTGCMTLFNGSVLNLIFLPQSSSDFMLTASHIMESFKAEL